MFHIKDKLAAKIWQYGKENVSISFFNSKSHQLYYIYYTKGGGTGLPQKTQMNTEIARAGGSLIEDVVGIVVAQRFRRLQMNAT